MFTGIIEKKAKILEIQDGRFTIENIFWTDLTIGQSIAHDGACMTIEKFDEKEYAFFAMTESLNLTNFWAKQKGDFFNIERCLQVWDRIDGHFVSGHIDAVGEVKKIEKKEDDSKEIFIEFPKIFQKNILLKGSITVNGTSLTVTSISENIFSVWIIPLTQEITNLWNIQPWKKVNLEFDMFGKYVLAYTK